jgi:hypothetical protein
MKTNKQLPIKQTSHIKLTIQQQELHSKHGVNSGASEELAVPDALMTPVALFLYMVLCYRSGFNSYNLVGELCIKYEPVTFSHVI